MQDMCKLLLLSRPAPTTSWALWCVGTGIEVLFFFCSSDFSLTLTAFSQQFREVKEGPGLELITEKRTGTGGSDWPAVLECHIVKLTLTKGYNHSKVWSQQTLCIEDEMTTSPHRWRNKEAWKRKRTLGIQVFRQSTRKRLVTTGLKFPSLMLSSASSSIPDISAWLKAIIFYFQWEGSYPNKIRLFVFLQAWIKKVTHKICIVLLFLSGPGFLYVFATLNFLRKF